MIAEHMGEEVIAAKSLQYFCLVVPNRALGGNPIKGSY